MPRVAHNKANLIGQQFGRLVVILEAGRNKHSQCLWKCTCACGGATISTTGNLRMGVVKSCGCLRKEQLVKRQTTHGMASSQKRHSLYIVWASMKSRCSNKNEIAYKNYGGRGITVCDEWMDFTPFMKWALANGYDDALEIDRKDNDGDYTPNNCRFVTRKRNQLNKRNNRLITIGSKTKPATVWAEIADINPQTLFSRLDYGWAGGDLLKPSGQPGWTKRKRNSLGQFC